jgi:hypothetical protein
MLQIDLTDSKIIAVFIAKEINLSSDTVIKLAYTDEGLWKTDTLSKFPANIFKNNSFYMVAGIEVIKDGSLKTVWCKMIDLTATLWDLDLKIKEVDGVLKICPNYDVEDEDAKILQHFQC